MLDWKPRRNGRFYCAPACGGKCTWEAHQAAKKKARALAKALGAGWKAQVTENLGWHYRAINPTKRLDITEYDDTVRLRYLAILAESYVGSGTTPQEAIANAVGKAKPELARFKALIALIEAI